VLDIAVDEEGVYSNRRNRWTNQKS